MIAYIKFDDQEHQEALNIFKGFFIIKLFALNNGGTQLCQ